MTLARAQHFLDGQNGQHIAALHLGSDRVACRHSRIDVLVPRRLFSWQVVETRQAIQEAAQADHFASRVTERPKHLDDQTPTQMQIGPYRAYETNNEFGPMTRRDVILGLSHMT